MKVYFKITANDFVLSNLRSDNGKPSCFYSRCRQSHTSNANLFYILRWTGVSCAIWKSHDPGDASSDSHSFFVVGLLIIPLKLPFVSGFPLLVRNRTQITQVPANQYNLW